MCVCQVGPHCVRLPSDFDPDYGTNPGDWTLNTLDVKPLVYFNGHPVKRRGEFEGCVNIYYLPEATFRDGTEDGGTCRGSGPYLVVELWTLVVVQNGRIGAAGEH